MKKESNHEKSIDELTPSAPASPPSPPGMDEKPSDMDVIPTLTSFFPLLSDSTSHIEISIMENDRYSQEIIDEMEKAFNLKKLRALKEGDSKKYYEEAKFQIKTLCHGIDALEVHNNVFKVRSLINIGYLLNEIEPTFQTKSPYVKWRNNNFGGYSPEYFQHAQRLAEMGDTADKYRSLGVNRLLDVDRLEKALGKTLDEILREHSFLDTTQDFGGSLFKAQVDAILTYYRFKKEGVDNIKMDLALQMAQYNHKAIEVREVKRVKRKYDEATDKDAFINKYVMDKMTLTGNGMKRSAIEGSLNQILAGLNDYFKKRIKDSEWVTDLKEVLDRNILNEAYGHLRWLKKKLKTRLPKGQTSTKKKRR